VIRKNASLGFCETYKENGTEVRVLAIFTSYNQEKSNQVSKLLNPNLLHLPLT